jgi:hypothetical protein
MADRITHDNPSVTTTRASVTEQGATGRPLVEVPGDAEVDLSPGVVRLTLDGTEYHALVEPPLTGDGLEIRRAADSPDQARNGDGPDRLREWIDSSNARVGGSALLDEVEPDFKYGLRAPGERAIYDATAAPDETLASIAEDVDGRD